MIHMAVLGSGSKGNATLVRSGDTSILIDAGLSAKQITLRMAQLGVSPEDINAILITHEHKDHTRGIDVFLRRLSIPVYISLFTHECIEKGIKSEVTWKKFRSGQSFQIGELNIQSFGLPHDASEPVGYIIQNKRVKLTMLSDMGHANDSVKNALLDSHAIYIESNYDVQLLEQDLKRPWSTKQRIAGTHGHLSNDQTADLIKEIANNQLSHVILCHLSEGCNTPDLAVSTVKQALSERGLRNVQVHCSLQHEATPWIKCTANTNEQN